MYKISALGGKWSFSVNWFQMVTVVQIMTIHKLFSFYKHSAFKINFIMLMKLLFLASFYA